MSPACYVSCAVPSAASITGGPVTVEWDVLSSSARTVSGQALHSCYPGIHVLILFQTCYCKCSSWEDPALEATWLLLGSVLMCILHSPALFGRSLCASPIISRMPTFSSDPGWALSWTWQMGEVILSCDGCETLLSQGT